MHHSTAERLWLFSKPPPSLDIAAPHPIGRAAKEINQAMHGRGERISTNGRRGFNDKKREERREERRK